MATAKVDLKVIGIVLRPVNLLHQGTTVKTRKIAPRLVTGLVEHTKTSEQMYPEDFGNERFSFY
jgi:hypothetical protein